MVEKEVNLVIEKNRGLGNVLCISNEAAARIGVHSGDYVKMHPPNQDIEADLPVRVTDGVYPFLVQIDPAVLESLKIKSLNVTLSRSAYKGPPPAPETSPRPISATSWQSRPPPSPPGQAAPVPVVPAPPKSLQFPSQVQPAPATNAQPELARWVLVPNQVDEYQQLVVDAGGNMVFGHDGDGYPLDSRGNSFTSANYYDLWAKGQSTSPAPSPVPPAAAATPATTPAAATPKPEAAVRKVTTTIATETPQRMQTVAPNQVDDYGVQITDAIGSPIFGMDPSGWYAIDSAGKPWQKTQWIDVVAAPRVPGARFDAVLIIDISRSMLARDLDVSNVEPTIRAIKRAMPSPKIQYFLNQFKEGTMIPRRMGAALATIAFLAEKISTSPSDKVAVIRFADMAETLDFDGAAFMDGGTNAQDMLERTAVNIVEKIGNSYGQATEMGKALYLGLEMAKLMGEMEAAAGEESRPVMCVLLTDGYPTDEEFFKAAIESAKKVSNLTLDIIGLGAPDKELLDLMKSAASECGGEFTMPSDTAKLLAWYTERARSFKPGMRPQPT